MTTARRDLLDLSRPGWVHCVSRCVRRAFLCGDGFDHRKAWIEERIRLLSGCFAVEVAGFAVMSNHLHVVVRFDPQGPMAWSAEDLVLRWLTAYPPENFADGFPKLPDAAVIAELAKDHELVEKARKRLGDLSWFMKALKEPISRRANREDGCRGTFWEGRFRSTALLDQAAVIAAMVYVDLNPIRAKIAKTPEASAGTSVAARATARNRQRAAARVRQRASSSTHAENVVKASGVESATTPETGLWVATMERCRIDAGLPGPSQVATLTPDEYLTLVDVSGRIVRAGKKGAIPPELAPILARLDLQVEDWVDFLLSPRQLLGAALGALASRMAEATRRGVDWVRNYCRLFAGSPAEAKRAA